MRELYLLALLCLIGAVQSQSRVTFYTKLSPGCVEANISKVRQCPFARNIAKSRWNTTRVKTQHPRFKTYAKRKFKCYYKLIEREQTCNALPACVMTTYTYGLPRPAKNVKATECANRFSISTNCNANGLENLRTVYSECFKKGARSFCSIDFQPCKAFRWTELMLLCYVPCNTSSFRGVAKQFVRKCLSHDGQLADEENCNGDFAPSKVSRKCLQQSTMKADIPMCNDTSTAIPTMNYNASDVPTTTSISNATELPDVTKKPDIRQSTNAPQPNATSSTSESGFPEVSGGGSTENTFDLLPVASGAGAGLLFVFILALIIVLLVRRKDHKSSAVNSILSSTSSYRTKSGRNPVVDSGSFRIATWIRERPSLPNGGSLSPSESVVSDAEYWKVGESVDDLTARYVQDRRDSNTSEIPDVVKNVSTNTGQENVYDDVYSSDGEDAPATSNRTSTPIPTRPSSSYQSQNDRTVNETPLDKSAVHAAVQKSRRREQMRKRSSAASMGAARRRIASQHSVTNLNGKHLRDGVLQIEFDDEQGVKCKLSESDTYIDLEEDELPSVF